MSEKTKLIPRTSPTLQTLKLLAQALKFVYIQHYDEVMDTTRSGKALPNQAQKALDAIQKMCINDTNQMHKALTRQEDGSETNTYQNLNLAQDLIEDFVGTLIVLSERAHQQDPERYTGGVPALKEFLRNIREGEVAHVAPSQYEGLVRTGMLHPEQL